MYEVRFSNIYILPHIIYYIHPLTIIITLTIKAVGFFAIHYGDIRYDLFLFGIFYYFRLKRLLEKFEEMKRSQNQNQKKTNTLNLFHVLNMLKDCPAQNVSRLFFDSHKNCTICNAFFSPWKMESFSWTPNLS